MPFSTHATGAIVSLYNIPLRTIDGRAVTLADHEGEVLLVVNVASQCGLTPQYEQLEKLQRAYEHREFAVLGFPCNQFYGQEPGTNEEIVEFCSTKYGVTFPLFDKIDVNGPGRHPLYTELVATSYADGEEGGDILWNFEKFLVSRDGHVSFRFKPQTLPDAPEVVAAIEGALDQPRKVRGASDLP